MFRIIVGVLAAFVGFSFGHSIPKWMENKTKPAAEMHSPSSSECTHPVRKLLLRRKSVRRFKFGSQKSAKENAATDESSQELCRNSAECNGSSNRSPLCASTTRVLAVEHKKSKFGTQKALKEQRMTEASCKGLNSSPNLLLSAVNVNNRCSQLQDESVHVCKGRQPLQELCNKSKIKDHLQQDSHSEKTGESNLQEPVFCKLSSLQSMSGSPVVEKSKMKKWKMKLMSLRSKAMASQKVWYEKFENENYGGKLLVPSSKATVKKQGKGKENESLQIASTKRRELSWSRSSSSKIGLLVEGPKSALER